MDNQVPTEMVSGKSYFIESKSWHRIIKGSGDLVLKITEGKKDQNKDGKNDFEDVKIARMKASGMSDAEIRKKHSELFNEEDYEKSLEEDFSGPLVTAADPNSGPRRRPACAPGSASALPHPRCRARRCRWRPGSRARTSAPGHWAPRWAPRRDARR